MKTWEKRLPKALAALLVVLFVGLGASDGGVVKRRSLAARTVRDNVQKLRAKRAVARRGVPRYASDRVLIRFRPAVSAHYAEGLLKNYGFPSARRIPAIGVYSVRTAPGVSVTETLAMLRRNPSIMQARPDYAARLAENPRFKADPAAVRLDALRRPGRDIGNNDPTRSAGSGE